MDIENDYIKQQQKRRNEVFQKLKETFFLPSPSGTVMEVVRLCSSEDSSLQQIADRLQTDPALSAELIKYANSAFLTTGIQVASVHKATVKLGMKNVVSLALGLSLLAGHRSGECEDFDYQLFWRTSLAEAIAARELAKRTKKFDGDELFVCGLLSHMGALSLATIYPDKYSTLVENCPTNYPLQSSELESFGIDSSELTAELFLEWGMPAHYALAAGFHMDRNNVELGSGKIFRIAVILNIAHMIAQMCQSSEPQIELLDEIIKISEEFKIDFGDFGSFFQTIVESWHEHYQLFEIKTQKCYSYSESDV